MTEQQENILIARLIEFREGSYNPTAMIRIIKSILSPLPHQDGSSAEDVLNGYYSLVVDLDDDCPIEAEVHDDSRQVLAYAKNDVLKAMHQFAKSETAKVVEKYEKEIAELKAKIDYLNIR